MLSFQQQRTTMTSGEPHDSFAQAIEDLDEIPLAYHKTGRNTRLSETSTECDTPKYASSDFSLHFDPHPAVGWDRDSGSTLKAHDGAESQQLDAEEEGELLPPGPPRAVGFWDVTLRRTRKRVFKKYASTLFILCIFVLSVLSIYWGVLFRVKENLHHATVAVVDFDGQVSPYQDVEPLVGPAIVKATQAELLRPDPLGYQSHHPAKYNYDPAAVRLAVHQEKLWAAIIINANATSLLRSAVLSGNTSYDPLGAAQIVYNQARDIESYNQYISPVLVKLASDVTTSFGRQWTSEILTNSTYNVSTYSKCPQALSPAIGFSVFNLRPFDPPVAIPAVSIGLIYLIIIAFFSFGFFIPTHMQFITSASTTGVVLKFRQLILWRYSATIVAYFLLSLCYSLISLGFLIPFDHSNPAGGLWPKDDVANNANPFGHGTFVVYWLLNFCGMSALGLACENVAMIIGTPWTALWLIFWVITNVATGFYALELAPHFYGWGYVWPLRQIVYASRTLLFGTHNRLGFNFGILILWIVVGTILFPFCCYFMRWKTMREKRKAGAAIAKVRS